MENLFLVCLVPPVSIVEDIDEIRTYISEKFNVYESLKRPAHITLFPPVKLSSQETEKRFFKALEDAAFSIPFTQVLRNFNSFPEHTFYLDVEQNEEIINLEKQIKKALLPLKLQEKRDTNKFNPHLTLAFKDVKPPFFSRFQLNLRIENSSVNSLFLLFQFINTRIKDGSLIKNSPLKTRIQNPKH
jgi:2'-5' RNA ligase